MACLLFGNNATGNYSTLNNASFVNTITDSVVTPCTDTLSLFGGLCAGDSVYFYGRWIYSPGSYDTLVPGTTCDTFAQIFLAVQDPLPGTHIYDTICDGDSILFDSAYRYTAGTYYSNGSRCASWYILELAVRPRDTVNIFGGGICAGDSVYIYGKWRYSAGTFDTTISGIPCDTLVELFLAVQDPLPPHFIYDTICAGDSVYFDSAYRSAAGTYYSNGSRCTSWYILELTVTHSDTLNLFGGLCAGDSVYFYGRWLFSPGFYDTILSGPSGCDTVANLNLVVQDPLPPTYLYDTICANDSVAFGGVYYHAPGVYTAHYSNVTGCDSSVILSLIVVQQLTSVVTQVICWDQTYYGYNTDGQYTDTFTSAGGCDSIRTLNLAVIPVDEIYDTMAICQGETYLGHSAAGNYTDTITNINNCDKIRHLNLTVNPLPVVTLSWDSLVAAGYFDTNYIYLDTTYCGFVSSILSLEGGHPFGGRYSGNGIYADSIYFDSLGQFVPMYPYIDTITYTYTDTNGCTGTATDTVVIPFCEVGIDKINGDVFFYLFPNPAKDYVIVEVDNSLVGAAVRLTDITGRQITKSQITIPIATAYAST